MREWQLLPTMILIGFEPLTWDGHPSTHPNSLTSTWGQVGSSWSRVRHLLFLTPAMLLGTLGDFGWFWMTEMAWNSLTIEQQTGEKLKFLWKLICIITPKWMVGRWNCLLKWPLFRGHVNFLGVNFHAFQGNLRRKHGNLLRPKFGSSSPSQKRQFRSHFWWMRFWKIWKDLWKWMFPKIGYPKWMVKIMENPIKMGDLGVTLFLETPKWIKV